MTLYEEIQEELRRLYRASCEATRKEDVRRIESRISYLESLAAGILR